MAKQDVHYHAPIISGPILRFWTACRVAIAKATMLPILLAAFCLLIFQPLELSTAVACTACFLSSACRSHLALIA